MLYLFSPHTGDEMAKSRREKEQPMFEVNGAISSHVSGEEEISKEIPTQTGVISQGREGWTSKAERQEIFLPVSGFVWLYPEEIKVINHPIFQRLGNINQLGQTYLVYRGATHKRLEHSLGTLHIVQRMMDAVSHTCDKHKHANSNPYGAELNKHEERFIRLGALLHDIGHIAYGHTIEDELCITFKHDSPQRLERIFIDTKREWLNEDEQTLGQLIDKEFEKYVPDDLKESGISASAIVCLLIRKNPGDGEPDKLESAYKILKSASSVRLNICRDMIGNTICADILDYLHRDWYHIGKYKPLDERILQYLEIHTPHKEIESEPQPTCEDVFVVSLGKRPKIRTDAVSAILELLDRLYSIKRNFQRLQCWIGHSLNYGERHLETNQAKTKLRVFYFR